MMEEIKCDLCGTPFKRIKGEINRSKRLGRLMFCSRACAGRENLMSRSDEFVPKSKEYASYRGNKVLREKRESDPLHPFYWHIRVTKARKRQSFDLTPEYLLEIWDKQEGKCAISGIELVNSHKIGRVPNRASLDRIDPGLGYIKGNVQWVSMIANYAKAVWTNQDVVDFGFAVAEYNKNRI